MGAACAAYFFGAGGVGWSVCRLTATRVVVMGAACAAYGKAGALRSATWSGSFVRMDGRSQRQCLRGYLCTSNSTLSVPIRTDRHALKWQLELAAADTLQSAPSESTPQALHKPRKRRTLHTTLVAVRRHTLQLIRPEIHSAAIGAGFV